jgi:hypothetical protein
MKPSFTQTTTFEPTIEQLAYVVAHLNSEDHARLISLIAEITQGPDYSEAMQLQYITDEPALTRAGRRLMEQIGAYALPLPEQEVSK